MVNVPTGTGPKFSLSNALFLHSILCKAYSFCKEFIDRKNFHALDDALMMLFLQGRLAFKCEGGGKTRIFAIPNALKQALIRPAHDWCMSVLRLIPMDGTFNQMRPLDRLIRVKELRSFDLSSCYRQVSLVCPGRDH